MKYIFNLTERTRLLILIKKFINFNEKIIILLKILKLRIINKKLIMSERDFVILKKLGEGSFGDVYKVKRISDMNEYAMKKVSFFLNTG